VGGLDKQVLGLFNASNMSLEWNGPTAQLQQADGTYGPAVTCRTDQRPANEPSLADMTTKALATLDKPSRRHGGGRGFFLQVEGASIDKRDHAANPCQQIGETIAFDRAIGVALDYQRAHPDTLVVLTADHGHTSQIVAEDTNGEDGPTGYAEDLLTKDGQKLRISYGTAGGLSRPSADTLSQQHTGTEVRIAAVGPQAARVNGVIDETASTGSSRRSPAADRRSSRARSLRAGGHRVGSAASCPTTPSSTPTTSRTCTRGPTSRASSAG
jgi:alkaline phosphatase